MFDLVHTAHPQLDDEHFGVLVRREYRGGNADLVVLVALGRRGLEALREDGAQEVLRRRLAGGARHANDDGMQPVAPESRDLLEGVDTVVDDDHGAGELACDGDDVVARHARAYDDAGTTPDRATDEIVAVDAQTGHGEEGVVWHYGTRVPGQARDDAAQRRLVTDILAARDLCDVGNRDFHVL